MAKNYTLTEAIITAHENGDMEALADLGRRYPLLMAKVQRLVTKAGEEAVDLAQYFPEYLSANKVNKAIKDGAPESSDEDDDTDEDEADEAPKKKAPAAGGKPAKGKKADDDSDDEDGEESKYASMSSRDLWNLLGKLNARKACEKEFGDLKKGSMVKYLEKYGEGGAPADDDEDDAEEETEGYEGKSAVELYKLCKSRKIKAEPKKPAKYYIDLLKKADTAAKDAEDEAEDDEEEWDDDEDDAPAPKKSGKGDKKVAAKTEKPVKGGKGKKAADEDDEDDEWEI